MYKNVIYDSLEKMFFKNVNSHSYIFYTNNFYKCQEDVYTLVKRIFNVENLNQISSDFIVISKTEKKNILKDDMVDLRNFFQKTSYISEKRLYLIEEAHKLNSTSANMILKFLEEPLNGIIAFFITDNLDNVLPTIKSRCQVVNCFYDESFHIKEECKQIVENLFSGNRYINIFIVKNIFANYDRNSLISLFNDYLNFYYLNFDVNNKKKIFIINQAINMLNNNVNIDYIFDYICIEGGK